MINVCKEEGVSKRVFLYFCCCWLYHCRLCKHSLFMCEGQLMKMLGIVLSGDQKNSHVELYDAGASRIFEGRGKKSIFF